MLRRLTTVTLVILVALTAGYSRATLDRLATMPEEKELLYLPSGKHLRIMSLGHTGLMADLAYIWAIQYYSNYDRDNRKQYVEHVFNIQEPIRFSRSQFDLIGGYLQGPITRWTRSTLPTRCRANPQAATVASK